MRAICLRVPLIVQRIVSGPAEPSADLSHNPALGSELLEDLLRAIIMRVLHAAGYERSVYGYAEWISNQRAPSSARGKQDSYDTATTNRFFAPPGS